MDPPLHAATDREINKHQNIHVLLTKKPVVSTNISNVNNAI